MNSPNRFLLAIMICLWIVTLINFVNASIVIEVNRTNNAFPIEYIGAFDTENFTGLAEISVGDTADFSYTFLGPFWQPSSTNFRRSVVGFRILNTSLEFMFDGFRHVTSDGVLTIGAAPGTIFARRFSSFLLAPLSDMQSVIVLNPINVTAYAYGGQIYYTGAIRDDRGLWVVNGSIQVGGGVDDVDRSTACRIEFGGYDLLRRPQVPGGVMMDFGEILARRNISLYRLTEAEYLDRLPPIEYRIIDQDAREIQVSSLEPREYIGNTNPYEHNPTLLLTDHGSYMTPPTPIVFPGSITKDVVLHFDIQNNRIGFGEPLIELTH